jgi:hypothetical protein
LLEVLALIAETSRRSLYSSGTETRPMPTDSENALRAEAWAGEARVNLIRVTALLAFYGHFLIQLIIQREVPPPPEFVQSATALVVAWACLVLGVYVALNRRALPEWLPYATAIGDVVLITALLTIGNGVRSPLVILYWLAIASTPLRLSLHIVSLATLAAIFGYFIALGYYAYFRIGSSAYFADPSVRVPKTTQVIVVLGLIVAGLLAGQAVRQTRRLLGGGVRE